MRIVAVLAFVCSLVLGGCQKPWIADVRTSQGVPGLDVKVSQAAGQVWLVRATNNSGSNAKLIWDESTYVTSAGTSDRIIRGATRVIDASRAQPFSPIASGATLEEAFVREVVALYGPGAIQGPADPAKTSRIVLVFEVNGRKCSHESAVSFRKE
jgi:hypothetical protein